MTGTSKSIVAISTESGSALETGIAPLTGNIIHLKVECDFANRADTARFYHSSDGRQWTTIGKPLKMIYTLPHFMGYRFALFNYATKTAGGFVDFDYFRLGDQISAANLSSVYNHSVRDVKQAGLESADAHLSGSKRSPSR